MKIPQADPGAGYLRHRAAIDEAIRRVLESGWYILGPEVDAFEREFADYLGVEAAVGVANGTDAIELALRATGVGSGHAVFTVSNTAVATVAAIESAGAVPILVDIDPRTYTIDPDRLEDAIRRCAAAPSELGRPRAIVAVHLFGHPADLERIVEISRRHDLLLVEDCAQAHGARFDGKRVGGFGNASSFSFYPTKNLGALGDGGAIATGDETIASRARSLRQYGWVDRYVSGVPGTNSRLDELQAALLRVKLRHLDEANDARRSIAATYAAGIRHEGVRLPTEARGSHHVYHQFVVRATARDALQAHLADAGVGTAVHYPVPIHLQPAYRGRLPLVAPLTETESAASEILSLPIFPELPSESVQRVVAQVNGWTRGGHA